MLLRKWHALIRAVEASDKTRASMKLRSRLEGAERFIFSETAAQACRQLAEHPEQLLRARSQLFAPYPTAWFELPDDRGDAGFLWTGDDARGRQGGLVFVQWLRATGDMPIGIPARVDLDAEHPITWPDEAAKRVRALVGTMMEDRFPTEAECRAAVVEMLNWMLAGWALLASKGMTGTVAADMTKLNKSRAAKGLYPLLGYRMVRLNIDAEAAVRAKSAVATGRMPLHGVRAHLRLLASGRVVIVSAHTRGNPAYGMRRSHYEVVRSEDVA